MTVFPVTSFVCICELVALAISSFFDGANNHSRPQPEPFVGVGRCVSDASSRRVSLHRTN
ncbi:hypothetical protein PF003_g15842 [Phytophthora fragariae]|nr:hypothetical protein PF003_g15842 [Phytophthora fragariae]